MTHQISESLSTSHDDAEWAIAAILNDRVVALLYLTDIEPNLAQYLDTAAAELMVRQWAGKATPDFQQLRMLGDVSAGVVTADGFEARWKLANWEPCDELPEALE